MGENGSKMQVWEKYYDTSMGRRENTKESAEKYQVEKCGMCEEEEK